MSTSASENPDQSFTQAEIIATIKLEQWEVSKRQDPNFDTNNCVDPSCDKPHFTHSGRGPMLVWGGKEHFLCRDKLVSGGKLGDVIDQSYLTSGANLLAFMRLEFIRQGGKSQSGSIGYLRHNLTASQSISRTTSGNSATDMTHALARTLLDQVQAYIKSEYYSAPVEVEITGAERSIAREMESFLQPIVDKTALELGLSWSGEELDNVVLSQLRQERVQPARPISTAPLLFQMRVLQKEMDGALEERGETAPGSPMGSLYKVTPIKTLRPELDLGTEMLQRITKTRQRRELTVDEIEFLRGYSDRWTDFASKAEGIAGEM